jgi:hypothetical protein
VTSAKSQRKQERNKRWKKLSPPDDKKFPEFKKGYPDSYIKELADADSFHMDATQKVTSILATGDYYQYRGPKFVAQEGKRKKIYNDYGRSLFSILGVFNGQSYKGVKPPLYIWASQENWKEIAMFPEQGGGFPRDKGNFYYLSDVGQRRPYPWQAHHLIPESVFTEGNTKFNEEQMMVLERSFYNINNGHNIIMLPADSRYSPVHKLIAHLSSHANYTIWVKSKMEELADALTEVFENARKTKDHLAPFKAILKRLHQIEDRCWDYVLVLSEDAATGNLTDTEEEAVKKHGGAFSYATTDKNGKIVRHPFGIMR